MSTISLWQAVSREQKVSKYPSLQEDVEVDVAIIGAGITGLSAAQHLIAAGKKVAILDAYRIGDGTTGNSTGNLYIETQPYFQNIKAKFGLEVAKIVAHSRKKAIDEIEKNVNELNLDCNFSRRPWYLFTANEDNLSFLTDEVKTLQELDINIHYISELPLSFEFIKAATITDQARMNPLKYCLGLADYLRDQGCLIFENTKVTNINDEDQGVIGTLNGKVRAKKIIVATHTPIGVQPIQMYTAPYRSYVIAVRLQNNYCPEGHFWGIGEDQNISSTHSISEDNKPELLLIAGRHHKTGQTHNARSHFKELKRYLKNQIPYSEIIHQWSAQHYKAADDIPYIGRSHKSEKSSYLATGYFADGLIYGVIAGKILSDMIIKGDDELTKIYDPHRSTTGASLGFLTKETVNVFMQYIKDLPFNSRKNYQGLKAGEGRIVEMDSEKWAISKDEQNNLHIVSAVCTHMKCIVNWNNAEKTWDCPCHGSRFSQEGKVLEGPAISDLKNKNLD